MARETGKGRGSRAGVSWMEIWAKGVQRGEKGGGKGRVERRESVEGGCKAQDRERWKEVKGDSRLQWPL